MAATSILVILPFQTVSLDLQAVMIVPMKLQRLFTMATRSLHKLQGRRWKALRVKKEEGEDMESLISLRYSSIRQSTPLSTA